VQRRQSIQLADHKPATQRRVDRVEGTLYPLLNRLARDGLLAYEWQESEQGPPRKYYWLTDSGKTLLGQLQQTYHRLHTSIKALEKGTI